MKILRNRCWLAGVVIALAGSAAHAVIVYDKNGAQNTTEPTPADIPVGTYPIATYPTGFTPWLDAGTIRTGSSVYLGNRWVLTAYHVESQNQPIIARFNGNAGGSGGFTDVPGTTKRLKNSDGSDTDLAVFQINADPGLPSVTLASSTPAIGRNVLMAGQGQNKNSSTLTYYNASFQPVPPNNGPIEYAGFPFNSAGQTMRWGTNQVVDDPANNPGTNLYTFDGGYGMVTAAFVQFDPVTNDGQGAAGDSGGPVFDLNTGDLVGIMAYTFGYAGQPGGVALLGDETAMIDIFTYRQQILDAISAPEPGFIATALLGGTVLFRRRRACSN